MVYSYETVVTRYILNKIDIKSEQEVVCTLSNTDIGNDREWPQPPQFNPPLKCYILLHISVTVEASLQFLEYR